MYSSAELWDWQHASYGDLRNSFMCKMAQQWDVSFKLTYAMCRAHIKAISYESFQMLSEVRVHETLDSARSCLHPDDILLICDDDDWYHPCLVEHLQAGRLPQDHIVLWPDGVYGFRAGQQHLDRVRERSLEDGDTFSIVKTNNYAVTGRLVQQERGLLPAVRNHGGAAQYVESAALPVATLPVSLSLVNRHPCSQKVLAGLARGIQGMEVEEVGSSLRRLVEEYAYSSHATIQPSFRWAFDYISQVKAVFRRALDGLESGLYTHDG